MCGAVRRPMMDLFEMIRKEHKEIMEATERLIGSDPADRVDTMGDLIVRALTHMSAEEHSIYPAIEQLQGVYRSIGLRNEEDHYMARAVLNDLLYKGLDHEHWTAKLQLLRDLFQRHMESEEDITFGAIAGHFTQEEINELADKYRKTQAELTRVGVPASTMANR